jgi:hypothetical protein
LSASSSSSRELEKCDKTSLLGRCYATQSRPMLITGVPNVFKHNL